REPTHRERGAPLPVGFLSPALWGAPHAPPPSPDKGDAILADVLTDSQASGSKSNVASFTCNASTLPTASGVPLPVSSSTPLVILASGIASRTALHATKQSKAQMPFGSAFEDHQRAS